MDYFPSDIDAFANGVNLDLRFRIMLTLIEKWGLVSARMDDKEDSSGRAKLRNMDADEVVNYAMQIAEKAVLAGEERGWVRPIKMTDEECNAQIGRLKRIQMDREFGRLSEKEKAEEKEQQPVAEKED